MGRELCKTADSVRGKNGVFVARTGILKKKSEEVVVENRGNKL